jgi:hypothetical protein
MEPRRKTLLLGCALAIAGCAQSGLNLTPGGAGVSLPSSAARGDVPLRQGRGRYPGSGGPEIYVFQGQPDAATPR